MNTNTNTNTVPSEPTGHGIETPVKCLDVGDEVAFPPSEGTGFIVQNTNGGDAFCLIGTTNGGSLEFSPPLPAEEVTVVGPMDAGTEYSGAKQHGARVAMVDDREDGGTTLHLELSNGQEQRVRTNDGGALPLRKVRH